MLGVFFLLQAPEHFFISVWISSELPVTILYHMLEILNIHCTDKEQLQFINLSNQDIKVS